VYCTGRTSHRASSADDHADGAETIEETAAMVDRAGGIGIPVPVDHLEILVAWGSPQNSITQDSAW
jgi:hypothetical protein